METLVLILLVISSMVLIFSILMQSDKSSNLSGSIGGGSNGLFGKKKARSFDELLQKITIASATIFMLSAFLNSII